MAGGAAMLFHAIAASFERNTIGRLERMPIEWLIVGSLASVLAGSFVAGWVVARFAPSASRWRSPAGQVGVLAGLWVMQMRESVVKLIASAVTLGSGVSMGPEGSLMQIGAAASSSLAGSAGVAKRARRARPSPRP